MLNDKYRVVNIRDYFRENSADISGEQMLLETISGYECPLNLNVERFLKEQAIEFTKKNQSVTYLVFSNEDAALVGYFVLTAKPIEVKKDIFSKTMQKKISRVSEFNQEHQKFHLSAYLIAQFGKNFTDGVNNRITGKELMQIAIDKVRELQYMLGGMVTFIEAERNNKLLDFYKEQNRFKEFDTRKANSINGSQLVQMVGLL